MYIRSVELKHFRCFESQKFMFDNPLVILEGDNGSGKTSLLESLHYGCYLRSFRTYNPRNLIAHNQESFFIKLQVIDGLDPIACQHEVQVGFTGKSRSVKLNQRSIATYKELMDLYRVVTITEDDLSLISGGPEIRRNFVDTAIVLQNPGYTKTLSDLKRVVEQRSSLLAQGSCNQEVYRLWTEQLWEKSMVIQQQRQQFLETIVSQVHQLIDQLFQGSYTLAITYLPKVDLKAETFEQWYDKNRLLYSKELAMGRTLFGAHLDDYVIRFQDTHSRMFASRGQQKLVVLLIKMAQVLLSGPVIMLLDDFLTDFDQKRAEICLHALMTLRGQKIITTPVASGRLDDMINMFGGQRIVLTTWIEVLILGVNLFSNAWQTKKLV